MICPQCYRINREGAKFCDECGYHFAQAAEKPTLDESLLPDPSEQPPAEEPAAAVNADDKPSLDESLLPDLNVQPLAEESDANEALSADSAEPSPEGVPADEEVADEPEDKPTTQLTDLPEIDTTSDDEPYSVAATVDLSERDMAQPSNELDLSGFVFDSDDVNEAANGDSAAEQPGEPEAETGTQSLHTFETQAIPVVSAWKPGNTAVLPRLDDEQIADSMKVSAPASKKEERARKRAMKRADKEARKKLRNTNPQSKVRNNVVIALLVILVIGVLAAGVSYYLELWGGKTVPATQGMTQADAIYTLQNDGFTVHVDEIKSDETAGLVLLSDPTAGSRIAEGTEITIHVAVSRTIPDVVGKSYNDALAALANEGFSGTPDVTYEKTSKVAEGTVLEISPASGSTAKSSTKISMRVATPYRVPDVTGQTQDNATYTLREAGYYVYISEIETSSIAEGTVYSTEPEANTVLDEGGYVTIYVAVQRATKLINSATSYLSSAGAVTIDGTSYTVNAVSSVYYAGNGVVNFTINGTPTISLLGETLSGSARLVSGTITYDSNDQIIGIG